MSFFLAVGGYAKKQAVLANEVFAQHVMQTMDSSLRQIEQSIVRELLSDEKYTLFFDKFPQLNAYQTYELSKKISDIAISLQSVDSIALYRLSDQTVLSTKTMLPLARFGDRAFIRKAMEDPQPFQWSDIRDYKEFDDSEVSTRVVSLVKKIPLTTGSQGLIVVNVRASAIEDLFNQMSQSKISYIQLLDAQEQVFYGGEQLNGKNLSLIESSYTGWTIRTGIKNKSMFDFFAILSEVWLIAGASIVAGGTIWLVLAVRRNYKPIETMKRSVQTYALHKNKSLDPKEASDEFAFINTAIKDLVNDSNRYEKKYNENLIFRKRWIFQQFMEGEPSNRLEEWLQEMHSLGLFTDRYRLLAVAVLEMDRYADFCRKYSPSDQQLLKFAVTRVIQESADKQSVQVWYEWLNPEQVSILFALTEDVNNDYASVRGFCENVRQWMAEHLKLTVTFGIGGSVSRITDAWQAYENALGALQYKAVLGSGKVIGHKDLDTLPDGRKPFHYLSDISLFAQYYRLGEEEWKAYIDRLFADMKAAVLSKDDIVSLMKYVVYSLQKEMDGLGPELRMLWIEEAVPRLNDLLQEFDILEDFETQFVSVLRETQERCAIIRESRSNHKLIHDVKEYIRSQYANPALSLVHLEEAFRINIKTLSRIFKEEFGEKFVDYLAKVRIDHAKERLKENPADTIENICKQVGYTNVFTFIRVFKKVVGMTPGEYRKE